MNEDIVSTEMFKIYFSNDRRGKNKKFTQKEREIIISAVKATEDTVSNILSFSKSKLAYPTYTVTIIFEKVSKERFIEKHENHHAMVDFLPTGIYLEFYKNRIQNTYNIIVS